jgi:hypothetical protein
MIYIFSHALSIYTVYVFNFENVVISHVSYVCECVIVLFVPALGFLCMCTTTVQYHVHRTRGGLDHYTTCKLTIDI